MLVIGLTGGIGSGKTTVANLFARYQVPIIDADLIAREVTRKDEHAYLAILDHFKTPLLLENGELDRVKLRTIIFNDPDERLWLEKLLHPLIIKEMQRRIQTLQSPYCIAVIPLITHGNAFPFLDRILVVDSPESAQIERVQARDKINSAQVADIIKTQIDRQTRLQLAHDVIQNDGDLTALETQVAKLHHAYLSCAGD